MNNLKWSFPVFFILFSAKAQQIDWNKINSNTALNIIALQNQSAVSQSEIIQIGNQNTAELSLNAKTDISVKQLGDYNTLYFVNSFTQEETKNAITTQGNNNIIDITGSNSISSEMQVNIKGDNKTVFIRNY